MSYSIESMAIAAGDDFTLTTEYKSFIESMITYLQNDSDTRVVAITPEEGFLYRFDLTAFLIDKAVPLEDHYVVMRMNGMSSVHEMDEFVQSIMIPNLSLINRLKQIFRTTL